MLLIDSNLIFTIMDQEYDRADEQEWNQDQQDFIDRQCRVEIEDYYEVEEMVQSECDKLCRQMRVVR